MTQSLTLAGVVRRYGQGTQIGPIDFSTERGVFMSLLGPSGCGKTTILRCIAGFEPIDDGTLLIEGQPMTAVPAHRRGVGLVFQNYALFPHLSVAENVAFGLRLRKIGRAERDRRVTEALRMVGLEALASRTPAQISGGQQQRVAIARSLVLEPSIMLLDEPLSNLDFKLRQQMRRELLALQRRLGMTFVFVTHDQTEALALSDQVVVLSQGRIEQIGSPSEIYQRPRTRFVADFIGGANLLKVASVAQHADARCEALLELGIRIPVVQHAATAAGDELWVSIRPEGLGLARSTEEASIRGRVLSRVFAGDRAEVVVQIAPDAGGAPALVTFYTEPNEPLGEMVGLCVRPGAAVLVTG